MHGVQSFIKEHRKSGVISKKHSRDMTNRISPLSTWNNVRFLPVTATYTVLYAPEVSYDTYAPHSYNIAMYKSYTPHISPQLYVASDVAYLNTS